MSNEKKSAAEDAKADAGLADTQDIKNALEAPPIHPAEGGIRDL